MYEIKSDHLKEFENSNFIKVRMKIHFKIKLILASHGDPGKYYPQVIQMLTTINIVKPYVYIANTISMT